MQSQHLRFRFADRLEVAAFARQLKEQLAVIVQQLPEGSEWVIAEGPRMEVYLAPKEVASSLQRLLRTRMPYSLGLFAGGVQHGELEASLELASSLRDLLPRRKVVLLRDEAEQPVLYGRDVLAGSIQYIERNVMKGELVVLANAAQEILALGQILINAKELEHAAPKQRVIRNLIDKGWYLRKGG